MSGLWLSSKTNKQKISAAQQRSDHENTMKERRKQQNTGQKIKMNTLANSNYFYTDKSILCTNFCACITLFTCMLCALLQFAKTCMKLEVAYNKWILTSPILVLLLFPLSTLDQFHATAIQTIQVCVYTHTHIYIFHYIHTRTHTYVYIYTHIHTHIYIYKPLYIYGLYEQAVFLFFGQSPKTFQKIFS